MTISAVHLTTSGSISDLSSYPTASISPSSNKLVLALVSHFGANAVEPTLSGNGLTWVKVAGHAISSSERVTLFRAMGASPSSGAVTIDFGGNTQSACAWSISEFDNVDTSGSNGSGAIVQAVVNNGVGSSLTVTLAAFSHADNATFGGFYMSGNGSDATYTVGSGFTKLGEAMQLDNLVSEMTEWRASNDTTVDASWTATVSNAAIGVEIKHAQAAAQARPRLSVVMA